MTSKTKTILNLLAIMLIGIVMLSSVAYAQTTLPGVPTGIPALPGATVGTIPASVVEGTSISIPLTFSPAPAMGSTLTYTVNSGTPQSLDVPAGTTSSSIIYATTDDGKYGTTNYPNGVTFAITGYTSNGQTCAISGTGGNVLVTDAESAQAPTATIGTLPASVDEGAAGTMPLTINVNFPTASGVYVPYKISVQDSANPNNGYVGYSSKFAPSAAGTKTVTTTTATLGGDIHATGSAMFNLATFDHKIDTGRVLTVKLTVNGVLVDTKTIAVNEKETQVQVTLNNGWNLVSAPVNYGAQSDIAISGDADNIKLVYGYSSAGWQYYSFDSNYGQNQPNALNINNLDLTDGYFVYNAGTQPVVLTFTGVAQADATLNNGWTLIGNAKQRDISVYIGAHSNANVIYDFNGGSWRYYTTLTSQYYQGTFNGPLVSGNGYWVHTGSF